MKDISNRTLAVILIAAILISFGGTLFGMSRLTAITGAKAPKIFVPLINAMAGIEATVNLSVTESVEANWTPHGLNWSQGMVDSEATGCTINSFGNTGITSADGGTDNNCTADNFEGVGGIAVSTGLNFTNQGNTNITLKLKMDKTAATFIGGTGVSARWNVTDAPGQLGTAESICYYRRNLTSATGVVKYWMTFVTTDTDVCDGNASLRPTPRNNTLRVDFEFVIPSDTPTGSKSAVITATYVKA